MLVLWSTLHWKWQKFCPQQQLEVCLQRCQRERHESGCQHAVASRSEAPDQHPHLHGPLSGSGEETMQSLKWFISTVALHKWGLHVHAYEVGMILQCESLDGNASAPELSWAIPSFGRQHHSYLWDAPVYTNSVYEAQVQAVGDGGGIDWIGEAHSAQGWA